MVATAPADSTRPSLEVEATGALPSGTTATSPSGSEVIADALPGLDVPSTSSRMTAKPPPSTARLPRLPVPALPATTTTRQSCAPTAPAYIFGLARQSDGNGWATGADPALLRSTDGGRTWAPACLPASAVQGSGSLQSIDFAADGRHGWVVGGSGGQALALRTVDGGDHWLVSRLPDGIPGTLMDVDFADADHGWAVGALTGSGPANAAGAVVLASPDGGTTWTVQSPPAGVGRLNRLSVVDAAHAWAVGVAADGKPALVATSDGGVTWTSQALPPGVQELRDVGFLNVERGWAVGELPKGPTDEQSPGVVLTTVDGGATWTQQATTTGDLWSLAVLDQTTVFAGGNRGLWSTRDGGVTWTKQPFALPALDAISFTDADHGWVTHSMFSTMCRTDDGGRTWLPSTVRNIPAVQPCTVALY